jgi:hypothetical protein
MKNIFKKSAIIMAASLAFTYADITSVITNIDEYGNRIDYNNRLYGSTIPISVYLMIEGEEQKAIELINNKTLTLGEKVVYKGTPYTDMEWAILRGYDNFVNSVKINEQNISIQERIKKNREDLFTNMELIQLEKLREEKLLESIDENIATINSEENSQSVLRDLAIDFIIRGYNDTARVFLAELDDVNAFNDSEINPLMATGFTETLNGGNVEMALELIYDFKADPSIVNIHKMNVMHIAAYNNAYKVIFAMADNGVSFLNVDETGQNPIDYAIESESLESVFILNKLLELWTEENRIN